MNIRDFTPTAEQISLHGLGFIQVKLPANRRLHVWHPDLPRRSCFEHSSIHNHRFSFVSGVIAGTQVNRRCEVFPAIGQGSHDLVSHDGPRSERGGRLSYVAGQVVVVPGLRDEFRAGQSYFMSALEYHDTPNDGIVITMMRKVEEGAVHASSLITHGREFDQSFDRFQLSPDDLWRFVVDAFRSVSIDDMVGVLA